MLGCGEVLGKVWGKCVRVWEDVGKCWLRCGKVCWNVGEVGGDVGKWKSVGGSVRKCVKVWGR